MTPIDFFRNSICLLKWLFLASLASNFSAISEDMPSKLDTQSAEKWPIFPSKASFERSLLIFMWRRLVQTKVKWQKEGDKQRGTFLCSLLILMKRVVLEALKLP